MQPQYASLVSCNITTLPQSWPEFPLEGLDGSYLDRTVAWGLFCSYIALKTKFSFKLLTIFNGFVEDNGQKRK